MGGKVCPMRNSFGYVSNRCCRFTLALCVAGLGWSAVAKAQDSDQVTAADMKGTRLRFTHEKPRAAGMTGADQATLPPVTGLDSVVNFSGEFNAPGIGPDGLARNTWIFNTLGNPPKTSGTTSI